MSEHPKAVRAMLLANASVLVVSLENLHALREGLLAMHKDCKQLLREQEDAAIRHAAELREQAERFEAFRQEVSDAVEHCRACSDPEAWTRIKFELERFIIAKPDPLVEAIAAALREASPFADDGHDYTAEAKVAAAAVRAHQKDTNA